MSIYFYIYNIYIYLYSFIIPVAEWNPKSTAVLPFASHSQQSALGSFPGRHAANGSSRAPLTRHSPLSRGSLIKQLQGQYRAQLSIAPLTWLANSLSAHFQSSRYASRAMSRSFSAKGRQPQGASLLLRVSFVELRQMSFWKGEKQFPPNGPQSLSLCQSVPSCLHS